MMRTAETFIRRQNFMPALCSGKYAHDLSRRNNGASLWHHLAPVEVPVVSAGRCMQANSADFTAFGVRNKEAKETNCVQRNQAEP